MTETEPAMAGYEPAPGHVMNEQITVGAAIMSRDIAEEVAAVVTSDMFYRPAHATIFAAVEHLLGSRDTPVSPATVMTELVRMGDLERVGAGPYLHTCVASVPTAVNGPYYASRVRADYRRRELWSVGVRVTQLAGGNDFDPDHGFDQARAWIDDVTTDDRSGDLPDIMTLVNTVLEQVDQGGATPGLRTGMADLDAMLNGLRPKQLIVIAGRPSMGKSVVALKVAAAAAIDQGKRVHFHSLEMSSNELTMRLLAAEARVPYTLLQTGQIDIGHWDRLAKAAPLITEAPLHIDDSAGQTVSTIRGKLRATARHDPAALVVVDYTQLLKSTVRIENRQQEVSEMIRGLKDLAKEFDIPVVALAQVNRNPESRADKRPILADLRESGEFENAADTVILLHRDDAYDRESKRPGEMDLIVAKQRSGPTGTVTVASQFSYARVVDMAPALH